MKTASPDTRTRILEAGAAEFAEHGFAAATVRRICSRAQVNIAAVNYHFGSKEELYREVLRFARGHAYQRFPVRCGLTEEASPDQRLHAYVRSFLLRTCSDPANLGWGTLVMREMVEPTSALDMMVEEGIRSLFAELVEIVRALVGESPEEDEVLYYSRSILSQCLFFLFSRSVINRMYPETTLEPADLERLGEEIVSFSLKAFRAVCRRESASRLGSPAVASEDAAQQGPAA